jgi:hypothetical protein
VWTAAISTLLYHSLTSLGVVSFQEAHGAQLSTAQKAKLKIRKEYDTLKGTRLKREKEVDTFTKKMREHAQL